MVVWAKSSAFVSPQRSSSAQPTSIPQWALFVALLVIAGSIVFTMHFATPPMVPSVEVMRIWADHNWEIGTTALPISRVSVLAKKILSKQFAGLPDYLHEPSDTIPVASILRFINEDRFAKLVQMCPSRSKCDISTPDPVHHLTPLHLASFAGDSESVNHLLYLGADPNAFDRVSRKPTNLTFHSFIENSKKFSKLRGSSCELPEIFMDAQDPNVALSEIHRLVAEGEPIMIRNLVQFMNHSEILEWDRLHFVEKYGQADVSVGPVPYASYFGLDSRTTSIEEYMDKANQDSYVFYKNDQISTKAFDLLDTFIQMAFPSFFVAPRKLGLKSIHFYLGQKGSGAPFHLHSDAVNLLTHGRKTWFITPPLQSVYSRLPIHEFVEDKDQVPSLKCEQNPGDAVFVPFDWGHAVLNTEDETFGFALEILNDRDSFQFLK